MIFVWELFLSCKTSAQILSVFGRKFTKSKKPRAI
jgi:hypothetical protein